MTHQVEVDKNATGVNPHLLKCKRLTLITTMNVRTLNGNSKFSELAHLTEKFQVDATCLQEHRIYHPDEVLKYHPFSNGSTLITSSAEKASNNATIGGVGIYLSSFAYKSLLNVESISPRILIATFNGNPKVSIVCCYSPTNCADEEIVQDFYNQLLDLIKQIPKHHVLLVCGDMNAKIGKDSCSGDSYHTDTNRNGEFLLDLLNECELVNLSTRYCKKKGKLWTFSYPNGVKAQLDHILINKKWKNSALDCQSYNTYSSLSSDHRPCNVKVRLSLRANKVKKSRQPKYDWSKLITDDTIKTAYTVEVRNRFEALQNLSSDESCDSLYQNIVVAHQKSSELHIPTKPKQKLRVPWETADIVSKRKALHEAFKANQCSRSDENTQKVENAKNELDKAYTNEQKSYVQEKIRSIETAHANHQSKLAWDTVNEITRRKASKAGQIRANSPEERIKLWKDHFENLLGQPPTIDDQPIIKVHDPLPISTSDFTMQELTLAIKMSQNNRATGLDEIPAEVWKSGCLNNELLDICIKTYHGDPPSYWLRGGIRPIPKKGDLGLANNYRGITLTSAAAKIYNRMLLNRLRPHLDPLLRINQNGFRPGRSTISQILTLRRLIEGVRAKQLPAVMIFVDFKKAFDSIHRAKLMKILLAYGVPPEIVDAIQVLYTNTIAQVLSPDGDTDFFEIVAGVLQGDTLAPYLFVIALDYAMRMSVTPEDGFTLIKARSSRYPAVTICDTDYADDIALLSDTTAQAEKLLHQVQTAAKQIGLHVNNDKTEFILFNQEQQQIKTVDNKNLKRVDDFLYLGAWIYSSERDINVRIAKAWAALRKLDVIWKSNLAVGLKLSFFRATVVTVLLYGSTTWTLTKQLRDRIDGCYTKMLRVVKGVSWQQHMTNKMLYGALPKISTTIAEQRLCFSGHCWRSRDEVIHKLLLWDPMHGQRPQGRPRRTYVDQLVEDTALPKEHLAAVMEDRTLWKERVMDIRPRPPR